MAKDSVGGRRESGQYPERPKLARPPVALIAHTCMTGMHDHGGSGNLLLGTAVEQPQNRSRPRLLLRVCVGAKRIDQKAKDGGPASGRSLVHSRSAVLRAARRIGERYR